LHLFVENQSLFLENRSQIRKLVVLVAENRSEIRTFVDVVVENGSEKLTCVDLGGENRSEKPCVDLGGENMSEMPCVDLGGENMSEMLTCVHLYVENVCAPRANRGPEWWVEPCSVSEPRLPFSLLVWL
jgi:hypothetical protein